MNERRPDLLFLIFSFILEIIFSLSIDVGAVLWIIPLVTRYRYFNYRLLVLVCIMVVFITALYFCFIRAPKIFRDFKKIVLTFHLTSFALFGGIIFLFINIVKQQGTEKDLSNQAPLPYCAYYIFSNYFNDCQGEALEAINEAISYDDKNAKFYEKRATLLIDIYENRIDDTIVIPTPEKQISYTQEECLKNAISDYTTALLLDPDNIKYVFNRGMVYAKRGNDYSDEVLADLRMAVENKGDVMIYCFEYAKALIDFGDGSDETKQEAKKYLDKAQKLATGKDEAEFYAYYCKALQDIDQKRFCSAYIKSIKVSDQNNPPMITSELENYLIENEDIVNRIIKNMENELDEIFFKANVWYEYGYLLKSMERYEEALECFNKIIERKPLYFDAYFQRSLVNNSLENYEDSINDITIMINHNDIDEYHIYRADYYYNNKDYYEAIEDYMFAVKNESNQSAYCYYSCGQSYFCLDDYENAITYYDKAIQEGISDDYKASCYKECGDMYYNLADMEKQNGNTEQINKYYKKAIKRYYKALKFDLSTEEKIYCHRWAGRAHEMLGNYKKANSDFYAAKELEFEQKEIMPYNEYINSIYPD